MTDRRQLCGDAGDEDAARRCLFLQAQYAIRAGIEMLQVREPGLEAADLATIVKDLVDLADGTATRIVVSDRVDVALACGAHGVHLRSDSVPASAVRSIAPPGFLVGRSVHTVAEAIATAPDVDYLIAGTVWPSASKPAGHPVLGLEGLAAIVAAAAVPVLAIGGITPERLAQLTSSGASGAAGIGLFMAPTGEPPGAGCRATPLEPVVAAARAV